MEIAQSEEVLYKNDILSYHVVEYLLADTVYCFLNNLATFDAPAPTSTPRT